MRPKAIIFTSKPNSGKRGPRFQNQDSIQLSLQKICSGWHKYLYEYVEQSMKIFGASEYPWKENERVIIGTLSAAITRNYTSSLAMEELSVPKAGNLKERGRVDLWASIPNLFKKGERFSFYLEAKKSQKDHTLRGLERFLVSKNGFSRILRDFQKNRKERLDQRSAYNKISNRKHHHFIIGMLITRLKSETNDPLRRIYGKKIKDKLQYAVEKRATANVKQLIDSRQTKRKLDRFPTVALIIPPEGKMPGMVAAFTVLAESKAKFKFSLR
ncbi:MAG: hypothetical protein WCA21_18005 [Terracidiphilus sp.]